jgi:hypothetical protein
MGFSHTRLPIQAVPDGELVGLPVREPERYLTRQELAEIMGISVRQVDRLRERGMPYENWGMRVVRFRPSVALAWVRSQGGQAA